MSAQPANTTISIFQRVRVYRDNRRHTSIKDLTTPFQPQLVAAPGEEINVLEHRNTAIGAGFRSDAFRYGHPLYVTTRTPATVAQVYAGVAGLDFPVRLPGNFREMQIQNGAAHLSHDLFADVRGVTPGAAFTI